MLEPLWNAGALAGLALEGAWVDAGTREGFLAASEGLIASSWPFAPASGSVTGEGVLLVDGAQVDPQATLEGPAVVDAGAFVAAGARVARSVVGQGAFVRQGAAVRGSVIGPGAVVEPGSVVADALVAAVR